MYCDNVNDVYLSSNHVQHQRTKHVEIDLHFVREKVAVGAIRVLHVPTSCQYAYTFTKGLPTPVFTEFHSSNTVRPIDVATVREGGFSAYCAIYIHLSALLPILSILLL